MKINSLFHVFACFMVVLIFSMPFVTLAQENSSESNSKSAHQISVEVSAKTAAERDAEINTNGLVWGGGSFVLGLGTGVLGLAGGCIGSIGIFAVYLLEPSPPALQLLGKSPEYIEVYTRAYSAKARNLRLKQASMGYAGGFVTSFSLTLYWLSTR